MRKMMDLHDNNIVNLYLNKRLQPTTQWAEEALFQGGILLDEARRLARAAWCYDDEGLSIDASHLEEEGIALVESAYPLCNVIPLPEAGKVYYKPTPEVGSQAHNRARKRY